MVGKNDDVTRSSPELKLFNASTFPKQYRNRDEDAISSMTKPPTKRCTTKPRPHAIHSKRKILEIGAEQIPRAVSPKIGDEARITSRLPFLEEIGKVSGDAEIPIVMDSKIKQMFEPSQNEKEECSTDRERNAMYTFYERLAELYSYQLENGNSNVPQKYPTNPQLGIWVNKIRMEKKRFDRGERSSLSRGRIEKLNQLNFCWGNNKGDEKWEEHFQSLVQYKEFNGHCNVRTKSCTHPSLGRFVSTQRYEYRKFIAGKRSLLDQNKVDRLEGIGFTWNLLKRNDIQK